VTLSYRLTLTGDAGQITATVPVGAG
jgi:hypothetical protein